MKTNQYITNKISAYSKDKVLHVKEKIYHAYYEKLDPERSSFMVEPLRRSVWPTFCLLPIYCFNISNKL